MEYFDKCNVRGNLLHLQKNPETSKNGKQIWSQSENVPIRVTSMTVVVIDLKPGKLVPTATKLMAVTVALSPTVHPSPSARSPIIAVISPMKTMDTMKAAQPCQ